MSGRYEPHEEYVPCDLASRDEMPSHWAIGRIKFMTMMNPSKSEVRHLKSDTPVTFLPMESIGDDGSLDVSKERPLHSVLSGYTYLAEGDVCVAKITPCFENGKGAIASGLRNGIGFATTEVIPMRCNQSTDSQFLYYFLTCAPFNLDAEASMYGAGGQKRVADSFVANYSAAFPPHTEQKQIASFLDYETAKIDALIAKQQQLIALLGEKRQAVISHAVTKGLNPDAPMRDSGVQWLGQVPEHWGLLALKFLISMTSGDGITSDSIESQGEYPVYGGNGLRGYTSSYTHDGNYVLIGRQGALCGNVNYAEDKFWASEHAVVATPTRKLETKWLGEMVRAMNLNQYSETAAQPGLSMAYVGNVGTALPPLDEQKAIAKYLIEKTAQFDELCEKTENAVELLQERRTALISAAVTGKIDVRCWKPPSTDSPELETEMDVEAPKN